MDKVFEERNMIFMGSLRGHKTGRIKMFVLGVVSVLIYAWATIPCPAAEVSLFAGSDIDGRGQGFSYAGLDVTRSVAQAVGLAVQVTPSYLTYKYETGGREIEAKAPGVSLLGGIKYYWESSMVSFFGGGVLRNTDLTPDDPYSSNRGRTKSALIQGECSASLTKAVNLYAIANYSFRDDFIYEKLKVKRPISDQSAGRPFILYMGLEQFFGENADYQGEGVGAVLELFHSARKFSVSVKSGLKHDSNFGNGIYYGLDLYKGF